MRAIEVLLLEVFRAQGLRNPARAAKRAADEFDRQRTNERIYDAHGTVQEIAEAHGVAAITVKKIRAREHAERKGAA